MSKVETPSLQQVHDQLAAILEDRVTELMTQIKTSQALSRRIARTEEEIERQRLLRDRLEAEIGPLRREAVELSAETESLQAEVDEATSSVSRLREIRNELRALRSASAEEA